MPHFPVFCSKNIGTCIMASPYMSQRHGFERLTNSEYFLNQQYSKENDKRILNGVIN